MAYLVLLEDDVSAAAAAFRGHIRSGWKQCVAHIEADPWRRTEADFRIVQQPAREPLAPDDLYFVADWFPYVIKYHARDYSQEDSPSAYVGEIRVVGLTGLDDAAGAVAE